MREPTMTATYSLFIALLFGIVCSPLARAREDWIWIEGESATNHTTTNHPWYSSVKSEQLSGKALLSHFNDDKPAEATFVFECAKAGDYEFWIRANPIQATLSYSLNDGPKLPVDLKQSKRDEINIAADDKPDLRFLAWIKVGKIALNDKSNRLTFHFDSPKHHHGYIDCFVFSSKPILPRGSQSPVSAPPNHIDSDDWVPFEPGKDTFDKSSIIDLRYLNERFAGEHGWIIAKQGKFHHEKTGEAVRFWGVNGPPEDVHGEDLAYTARLLAKYGVNLVRIHGAVFDKNGEVDSQKIKHIHEIVQAMKREGIYCHLSIYFPLWFRPSSDIEWLPGYDGQKHPFATLFFNPKFQAKHREWIQALLTTIDSSTGRALLDEPAVFGIEIQNEDSLFFWTFAEKNIPDPQLRVLESQFAVWLKNKYGSLKSAFETWKSSPLPRDNVDEERIAFRPLWNIVNERTVRDQDTAVFLYETQARFYQETTAYIKKLGFKGLVHASNWTTASPEHLTPLEKLSYLSGDFVDRHGYFSCLHRGENAAWSIRPGHEFGHRSALRFDAIDTGKPKLFIHPVMDPQYNAKPSMISETTFTRPNRFRSEAPLYYATYGALQDSDAIVHFAFDGSQWEVKPRFWTQPWTLSSPSMLGQFPAAALIYRREFVATGELMAKVNLNIAAMQKLQKTPLPQDAALDELRLQDIPQGTSVAEGQRIDPLVHYTGRTEVHFSNVPTSVEMRDLSQLISRERKTVKSSTGEIELNYGVGLLTIRSPRVVAVSGALNSQAKIDLGFMRLSSSLDLGHVVAIALDDRSLRESRKILLQVMTEEQATGFATTAIGEKEYRITELGTDPWCIRKVVGQIEVTREDAKELKVQALDLQGRPLAAIGPATRIELLPSCLYYLITKSD